MKKDEFANLNRTEKQGSKAIIIVAVIALGLVGILCAGKLKADSGSIFMDSESVTLTENRE